MKCHLLGALSLVLAISFSAFSKFAITENFLVQSSLNVFTRLVNAPGGCDESADFFCKYIVTAAGKANIPAKATYTPADIFTYLTNGWVTVPPGSIRALYDQ